MQKKIHFKMELKEGSVGNMIVVIKFDSKSSNYFPEDHSWCPTLDELRVLEKAKAFMEK